MTSEQCCRVCRGVRVENSPAIPYAMVRLILGIDRILVKCPFKTGLDSMHASPRNGRFLFLSREQGEKLIQAGGER
jgi:hypothetical protein